MRERPGRPTHCAISRAVTVSVSRTVPRGPAASRAGARYRSSRTAASTGGPSVSSPRTARRASRMRSTSASAVGSADGSTTTVLADRGLTSARTSGSLAGPLRQMIRARAVGAPRAVSASSISALSRSASSTMARGRRGARAATSSPTTVVTWSDQPSTRTCPCSRTVDRPLLNSAIRSASPVVITPTRVDTQSSATSPSTAESTRRSGVPVAAPRRSVSALIRHAAISRSERDVGDPGSVHTSSRLTGTTTARQVITSQPIRVPVERASVRSNR